MLSKSDYQFVLSWAKKIKAVQLLGGKCVDCGCADAIVLVFHHNGCKTDRISNMRRLRWSKIEKEIYKCELLCGRCHDIRHVNSRGLIIKKRLLALKGIHQCELCGCQGPVLDFHHENETKTFNFRDLTGRKKKFSLEQIITELDKCKVLCKNCHTHEHLDLDRFNALKKEIFDRVDNHIECPTAIDVNQVRILFSQGLGIRRISKKLGCSKTTISKIIKRHKIRQAEESNPIP